MPARTQKTPPHLNPEVKRLDARERQRHYQEEVAPRYRRSDQQRRRLPLYILRCEPERAPLKPRPAGYILGFNTLKALLNYLAICHAGVCPPRRDDDHLEVIAQVYQHISDLRAQGDDLDLDAALTATTARIVRAALQRNGDNISHAAAAIGVSRSKFYDLMARAGVHAPHARRGRPRSRTSGRSIDG